MEKMMAMQSYWGKISLGIERPEKGQSWPEVASVREVD